jgi:dipeptidase D
MQGKLSDLEPVNVFHYFEEIAAIPHGSYHVDKISDYLVSFAKERGLRYVQDDAKNVIIFKPASKEAKESAPLILQGHMDMVLEKNNDVELDMENEPIHLVVDGDDLRADGTTLGGDDGIAVAMMLAVLDDEELVHPPLECIFTTNEEVGMLGMNELDPKPLKGRRMLNLDSEEEGILTVGCAGGAEQIFTLPMERKGRYGMLLRLVIRGLRGGHSGACIHMGRANADLLMGRLLQKIEKKTEFGISVLGGGNKDNAIPRECVAEILMPSDVDGKAVIKQIEKFTKQVQNEYQYTDPDIQVDYEWTDNTEAAIDCIGRKDAKRIVDFLLLLPDGLIAYDPNLKNMPQTSSNLGILKLDTDGLTAVSLVRSSINSQRKYVQTRMKALAEVFDAGLETKGDYPAWEYTKNSDFRDLLVNVYEAEYGRKPEVSITHGGLECGLLAAKVDGLDCVSIGPAMSGIHTPAERLSISSTKRTYEFLKAALCACAGE